MARTVLPIQSVGRAGLDIVFSQADSANGHSFDNSGHNVVLVARNLSAGGPSAQNAGTITIVTPNTVGGLAVTDRAVVIPSGVEAAIADDGGVFTDETAEANDSNADDMTLLPATPAQEDAYYFGNSRAFNQLNMIIDTPGSGTWTITWEYWNGAWVALNAIDDTVGFTVVGGNAVLWEVPADWAPTTVNGQGPYWYVRGRVSAYSGITTQPLGQEAHTPGYAVIGPFPGAVYDTIDVDPDPDIDPAVFVDVAGASGIELAAVKIPGASY